MEGHRVGSLHKGIEDLRTTPEHLTLKDLISFAILISYQVDTTLGSKMGTNRNIVAAVTKAMSPRLLRPYFL